MLEAHQLSVSQFRAAGTDGTGVDRFRDHLSKCFAAPGSSLVLNYSRGSLGQFPAGNGHVSPVGAFHQASDK